MATRAETIQGQADARAIVDGLLDTKRSPYHRGMSARDMLAEIVTFFEHVNGSDNYTARELLLLFDAYKRSEWDFWPDQWTRRQLDEALLGIPPQWNSNETPLYARSTT